MEAISSVTADRVVHGPAEEPGHRRRSRRCRPAESHELQDRAVPDVGGAGLRPVARVVHGIGHRRRRGDEERRRAGQPDAVRACRCGTSSSPRSTPRPARPTRPPTSPRPWPGSGRTGGCRTGTVTAPAAPGPAATASCGSRLRTRRLVVPWVRMCTSSPIWTPCAASANRSMGPDPLRTSRSIGPATSRRNLNRSMAAGVSRPNQAVSPGPWLMGAKARVPPAALSTASTGAERPIAVAIGTTVSCS